MNSSASPGNQMTDTSAASDHASLIDPMLDVLVEPRVTQYGPATIERQALFVLGMHRAGTSAVTRMVNLLGARLPDNILGPDESNPQGHWESEDIIALHDEMLQSARSSWHHIFDIDQRWFSSIIARGYVARIRSYITEKLADAPIFVIKDPRICLLFPLWIEALKQVGIEPRCILPFRSPIEVARSLTKRNAHAMPGGFMPVEHGHLLWLRYVLAAERHTRGLRRTFVNFDHLLSDWEREADRMADQLDFTWPLQDRTTKRDISRFLSHEHKHQNEGDGAELSRLEPVYNRFMLSFKMVFSRRTYVRSSSTTLIRLYKRFALFRYVSCTFLLSESRPRQGKYSNSDDLDRERSARIEFEERFRLANVHIDNLSEQLASSHRHAELLKQEIERLSKAREEDLLHADRTQGEMLARTKGRSGLTGRFQGRLEPCSRDWATCTTSHRRGRPPS